MLKVVKLTLSKPKFKKYGTDTVAYKAIQVWSMLPARCMKIGHR